MALLHAWIVLLLASALAGTGPAAPPASAPLESADHSAEVQAPTASRGDRIARDGQRARATLESLAMRYRYLDDVEVRIADTPNGEEAVAYYRTGEIVIDPDHTVGIDTILAHEIWHVIDYRDDGDLDWGEDLPPSSSSDYLR